MGRAPSSDIGSVTGPCSAVCSRAVDRGVSCFCALDFFPAFFFASAGACAGFSPFGALSPRCGFFDCADLPFFAVSPPFGGFCTFGFFSAFAGFSVFTDFFPLDSFSSLRGFSAFGCFFAFAGSSARACVCGLCACAFFCGFSPVRPSAFVDDAPFFFAVFPPDLPRETMPGIVGGGVCAVSTKVTRRVRIVVSSFSSLL